MRDLREPGLCVAHKKGARNGCRSYLGIKSSVNIWCDIYSSVSPCVADHVLTEMALGSGGIQMDTRARPWGVCGSRLFLEFTTLGNPFTRGAHIFSSGPVTYICMLCTTPAIPRVLAVSFSKQRTFPLCVNHPCGDLVILTGITT